MELDSRKKSRRDRMMRSKSFKTQKMREIGITEDVFQMEGKECKDYERLKGEIRKFMPERGRCFNIG